MSHKGFKLEDFTTRNTYLEEVFGMNMVSLQNIKYEYTALACKDQMDNFWPHTFVLNEKQNCEWWVEPQLCSKSDADVATWTIIHLTKYIEWQHSV